MAKFGTLKSIEVFRAFKLMGWSHLRTKGSHHYMVSPDKKKTIALVVKRGKDMNPGYIQRVLRDAGIAPEEFRRHL